MTTFVRPAPFPTSRLASTRAEFHAAPAPHPPAARPGLHKDLRPPRSRRGNPGARGRVHRGEGQGPRTPRFLLLRSRPHRRVPDAIPRRLFSSSLPPSFVSGRFAALFFPAGTAAVRAAVIGSGIAGLAAAHHLQPHAEVTLFEAAGRFGGHAQTVDVTLPDAAGRPVTHGVDTGFLVYNERTYPNLVRLFGQLKVATAAADMSFSVQVPQAFGGQPLEWCGSNLASVFAQPANLVRPRFWRMLREVLRFNRLATHIAESAADGELRQPLAKFLRAHGFAPEFEQWYLLPMIGCIWSCPPEQMLHFPVGTLIRFCHNHGLLQVSDRPQWYTVRGGSREYVRRIVAGLRDARLSTPVLALRRGLRSKPASPHETRAGLQPPPGSRTIRA